jgi:DNA-binding transcriptional ArsR family regulator
MAAPFEELSALNRTVHEPARLAILTALTACQGADFLFLQSLTGLTRGNLWTHLAKLERAELVTIEKTFRGKNASIPHTRVRLTRSGRESIERHWEQLQELRKASIRWKSNLRPNLVARPQTA